MAGRSSPQLTADAAWLHAACYALVDIASNVTADLEEQGYVSKTKHSGYAPAFNVQYARAIYWALTTMSGVGYGDITPYSLAGKLVAGVIMLFGVCFMAMPLATVGSIFTEVWENQQVRASLDHSNMP